MLLIDTGIIVATIASKDAFHQRANNLVDHLRPPFATTLPCLTEAMYLLGEVGQHAQNILRAQLNGGLFTVPPFTFAQILRACELMQKYADAPMDFADASLVVLAEDLRITQILTLDGHFYAYRIHGNTSFEVIR